MIVTYPKGAVDRARVAHARRPLTAELGSVNHLPSLQDGRLALRILDQFSIGVVLLDQSARVSFTNAAAQSLSENGGPLRVNSGVADFASKHARRLGDVVRSVLMGSHVRTVSFPLVEQRTPIDGARRTSKGC